jgi:transcriptional regulator with XRE-family HTH domain
MPDSAVPHFDRHKLLAERSRAAMSREQLAVAADVPYGTLQRFEQGVTADPQINAMARIARALGVSLDALVSDR